MFFKKEKFSMTDLNIDKMLNGEPFDYRGEPPKVFKSIVSIAMNKINNSINAEYLKELYESIPECEIHSNPWYPNEIKDAWRQGRKLKEMEVSEGGQ